MQVLDQAWSNFRDSINSDKTLQVYEYCLEQFLLNCNLDLESLLKLESQKLTNLIIKYISELKVIFPIQKSNTVFYKTCLRNE